MLQTYLVALVLCAGSLAVGAALVRALGRPELTAMGPGIGLCALIVVATPVIRLPGHGTTAAIVLALIVAAALLYLRPRPRWPQLDGVVAGALILLLTALPFIGSGRFGILGVSIDDDLREHLWWTYALAGDGDMDRVAIYPDYPLGAHALVGAVCRLAAAPLEAGFTALMIAVALLTAWTALLVLPRAQAVLRGAAAAIVGFGYLAAAYFAWGMFKEPLVALALLTFTAGLDALLRAEGRLPWRAGVLFALPPAAALVVMGRPGIVWFAAGAVAVLAVHATLVRRADVRALALLTAVTAVAIVVLVAPQLGPLLRFELPPSAQGFQENVPFWELLGVWFSGDFRHDPATGWLTVALCAGALGLGLGGAWRLLRARRVALPAMIGAALVVYAVTRSQTQGYVTAKALAVAAPLVLLVIVGPLLHRARAAAIVAGCLFLVAAMWSSAFAVRHAMVGPVDEIDELAPVRATIGNRPVVLLAPDTFGNWKLHGTLVSVPTLTQLLPTPTVSGIPFGYGQPLDFDSLAPETLDQFDFAVTSATRFTSAPPENFEEVLRTRFYVLYERTGPTLPRTSLNTDPRPGVPLDCENPDGQRLARSDGTAGVLPTPILTGFPVSVVEPGRTTDVALTLPAGRWEISLQYSSTVDLDVEVYGARLTAPARLDWPGPFWPLGDVTSDGTEQTLRVHADELPIALADRTVSIAGVAAMPADVGPETVPLREACGRYVDWYRTGS